jgi:hypothetical protein
MHDLLGFTPPSGPRLAERPAARRRLLDHYRHTAYAANRLRTVPATIVPAPRCPVSAWN